MVYVPEAKTSPLIRTAIQSLIASIALGFASYFSLQLLALVLDQSTFWGIFAQGAIAGAVGAIVAAIVLLVLKNKDIQDFRDTLKRKFWKVGVVQELGEVVDK